MLRFSKDANGHSQKKRCWGMQNITVNYNPHGTSPDSLPVIVSQDEVDHAD